MSGTSAERRARPHCIGGGPAPEAGGQLEQRGAQRHAAQPHVRDSGDTTADVDMETAEPGQELNCFSAEVFKKQRSDDKIKIDLPWRR